MTSNFPDERKKLILKAVVTDYVITAEPVSSKTLVNRYHLDVKSATVRNDMAELSEMGYLRQPHTSAGRIPSDMGYRFYVDKLMDVPALGSIERNKAKDKLTDLRAEIDNILDKSCRILADLAQYTCVATQPNVSTTRINLVSVSVVSKKKSLVVIVFDDGRILHGFIDALSIEPKKAESFLMINIAGKTLEEACNMSLLTEQNNFQLLFSDIKKLIKSELDSSGPSDIHLQGTSYIMKQPEFKDIERLEAVLSVLEHKSILSKLLQTAYSNSGVNVIIGAENPIDAIRDCSFVGAQYHMGKEAVGSIGVIGPTRMNYKKAVAAVKFMSANLTALLEQLSLE